MNDEATAAAESPFTAEDIEAFEADDKSAGGNICRMLSLFFVYTVIAMGVVGLWTNRQQNKRYVDTTTQQPSSAPAPQTGH